MTRKALLAIMLIGLTQNGYCDWKDALKAVADKVIEQKGLSSSQGSTGSTGATGYAGLAGSAVDSTPVNKGINYDARDRYFYVFQNKNQPNETKVRVNPKTTINLQFNPQDELAKNGMWTDSRTGLTWTRELAGEANTWHEAMEAASLLRLGGYSDWRLPTIDEVSTIRNCLYTGFDKNLSSYEAATQSDFSVDYPADDGTTKHFYNRCQNNIMGLSEYPKIGNEEIFSSGLDSWVANRTGTNEVFFVSSKLMKEDVTAPYSSPYGRSGGETFHAVRGGKPSDNFSALIATALKMAKEHKELTKSGVAAQAAADKKSLDDYNRRNQEEHRRFEERYAAKKIEDQKRQAAYNKKKLDFQKSIKPGDRAYQGLVLEVKGDLVKIQAYGKRCYGGAGTSVATCHPAYIVPDPSTTVGEQWIRRDAISPAQ